MKQYIYPFLISVSILLGCSKPAPVEQCYTCTQFITYNSTSPYLASFSPETKDVKACSESEKTALEKKQVKVESLGGTYTLTTTTQTVCRR